MLSEEFSVKPHVIVYVLMEYGNIPHLHLLEAITGSVLLIELMAKNDQ